MRRRALGVSVVWATVSVFLVVMGLAAAPPWVSAREIAFEPNLADVAGGTTVKVLNCVATVFDRGGRPALRLDERAGDGLVLWPDVEFSDGTIELDVRGRAVPLSFVGVAFHGRGQAYEAVYFRPFNFRHADPVSRSHAVQYVSNPTYTWDRLRAESPGKYEKPVVPAPDPEAWLHARVVVAYPTVSVFVNGATEPSLVVEQLSTRRAGWLGLWVGNGSSGEFASLKVSPVLRKRTFFGLDSPPIADREPEVTDRFRAMILGAMAGDMRSDDYAPELWAQLAPARAAIQADLQRSGALLSLSLIDRQVEGGRRSYRYLLDFEKARAVERFVLDEQGRAALIESEDSEPKAPAAAR